VSADILLLYLFQQHFNRSYSTSEKQLELIKCVNLLHPNGELTVFLIGGVINPSFTYLYLLPGWAPNPERIEIASGRAKV
jgi:hypothetical protein